MNLMSFYRYNNKTYIIEDIDFEMNTESKFELSHDDDQFQVSFYDYFTKRYKEEITQKKQPMILARTTLPKPQRSNNFGEFEEFDHSDKSNLVHIVPELCYLVGMTEQMRSRKAIWREYK